MCVCECAHASACVFARSRTRARARVCMLAEARHYMTFNGRSMFQTFTLFSPLIPHTLLQQCGCESVLSATTTLHQSDLSNPLRTIRTAEDRLLINRTHSVRSWPDQRRLGDVCSALQVHLCRITCRICSRAENSAI